MMAYVENSARPVTWARDTGACLSIRPSVGDFSSSSPRNVDRRKYCHLVQSQVYLTERPPLFAARLPMMQRVVLVHL